MLDSVSVPCMFLFQQELPKWHQMSDLMGMFCAKFCILEDKCNEYIKLTLYFFLFKCILVYIKEPKKVINKRWISVAFA